MLSAAVIGCGHGGGLSLDALLASPAFRQVVACDPSAAARRQVSERFPSVAVFSDYRDALASDTHGMLDVACVATPAPTHESIARELLTRPVRGLLLEKPIACDSDIGTDLVREVRSRQLPVAVPHGLLVLPTAIEIKSLVRRGDIGELSSVRVQNRVDLLNGGIHWLVFLLDLLEVRSMEVVSAVFDVSERVVNDGVQVETCGSVRLSTTPGVEVQMDTGVQTVPVSDVLPEEAQRGALFLLQGSTGRIEFSAWAGSYYLQTGSKRSGELIRRSQPDDPSYHQIFLEQLARQIDTETLDYASLELSLAALQIIERAYRSSNHRSWRLGIPAGARAGLEND